MNSPVTHTAIAPLRHRAHVRRLLAVLTAVACALVWQVVLASSASATATATAVPNPDAFVCNQPTSIGFEDLADNTNISAQSYDGVSFTTTSGATWRALDFATGYYNGKYPRGAYMSQGTHAAWLGTSQGSGRIDFDQRASTVSLLVSSYTPVTMEAYSASGALLESTPFSRSNTNTGQMDLLRISRSSAQIAYVIVHDSGNYFLVDSLCTDASTTTPGTDLSITKSDAVDPVPVQDEETFTLEVTNNGPLDADIVDVTDAVPSGFSVTAAVPSQGTCPSAGNNVVCNLGPLAVGASATVAITATAGTAGTYTNTAGVGSDTADASPGNNTASITTTVNGTPDCTITGTPRNDTLTGTPGDDVICGLAGNDTIRSSGGDDVAVGGAGSDTLSYANDPGPVAADLQLASGSSSTGTQELVAMENLVGSPAADQIGGDDFNNTLDGGAGNDNLAGRAGNDVVRGGADNDQLFGGSGSNGLDGGSGVDTLRYGSALGPVLADLVTGVGSSTVTLNDTFINAENIFGSPYDDQFGGDDGPNTLVGGGGDDNLAGRGGDDIETGAAGADFIFGGTGANSLDGGPGPDTVSYGSATTSITASLVLQTATGPGLSDELVGFENLTGGPENDVLTGDANDNVISGGGGEDLIGAKGGDDLVDGGGGADTASFTGAPSVIIASLLSGTATGEGSDILVSIENLIGGSSNDQLTGTNGANTIAGGLGADRLTGLGGQDTLNGDGGNDSLFGGGGNDTLSGGNGVNNLDGGPNFDTCTRGGGSVVNCEG